MPGGRIIGVVFFLLLAAAALTSMVALLEVPVSVAVHRLGLRRWSASALVGGLIFAAGVPSAMSFGVLAHIQIGRHGILDAIDTGVSNFLLPLGGVLVALFVGWRLKRQDSLWEADLDGSRLGRVWLWLLRVLVPVTILVILLRSASTL